MLLLLLDQILFLLWRLMIIEWQSFLFGCVFALGAGAAVLPLHLAHALGRPRASPLCLEHGFLGTGRTVSPPWFLMEVVYAELSDRSSFAVMLCLLTSSGSLLPVADMRFSQRLAAL